MSTSQLIASLLTFDVTKNIELLTVDVTKNIDTEVYWESGDTSEYVIGLNYIKIGNKVIDCPIVVATCQEIFNRVALKVFEKPDLLKICKENSLPYNLPHYYLEIISYIQLFTDCEDIVFKNAVIQENKVQYNALTVVPKVSNQVRAKLGANMHGKYREFWIKDTTRNRKIVDEFYEILEEPMDQSKGTGTITDTEKAALEQLRINGEILENGDYGVPKDEFITYNIFSYMIMIKRFVLEMKEKGDFRLWRTMTKKALEGCSVGISAGYLLYAALNPDLIELGICPYFEFEDSNYSDDKWEEFVENCCLDPENPYYPYISTYYNQPGFNRYWRTDRWSDPATY